MPNQNLTDDEFIRQMTVGTLPENPAPSESFIGKRLAELGISPADFLLMAGKVPSAIGLALTPTPAGAGEEEELARLRGLTAQETATTEGGAAKALLQAIKSKNPAAAAKAIAEAPQVFDIKKSGKLSELEKELIEVGGKRQGLRLQRAADEIPGLEDQYQAQALRRAFLGRKGYPYQALMTLDPKDFQELAFPLGSPLNTYSKRNIEKLREVLRQGGSFDEVPFLMIDKKDDFPSIVHHEGRHRTRALAAEKAPKTLVELYPRRGLEMGADDDYMTSSEWLRRFNEELGKRDRFVFSEDEKNVLKLPDVYAEGGEVTNEEKEARTDKYRAEAASEALMNLINNYRMTGRGAEDIARVTGLPVTDISKMFGASDTSLPSAELAQESRLGEFRETTPKVMTDEGTRLRPGYELRSVPKDLTAPIGKESLEDYIRRYNIQRSGVNPRAQMFAEGGEVTNEDFIQQMTVGTPPTDQEPDRNVPKDIVRGIQYTPFDVLGAPVDIATMAMRPFGYSVEKPVGGSDWFIEQAAKRGLAQPSTGSGAELLGRIVGGVTTPAAAKGVGKVAAKTEDFISGQLDTAAKRVEENTLAKLREKTGNPNLTAQEVYSAMFAKQAPGAAIIKPKGGNVILDNIDEIAGIPVRSSTINKMRPRIGSGTFASDAMEKMKQTYTPEVLSRLPEDSKAQIVNSMKQLEPKAALDNWIQTKLGKYIRTDMGTEGDPVRKLAEEMSTKVRADYETGLKRIAKMKDDIAKAKAAGKNTDLSEEALAAEIDKVENAYRQTSMLPVSIGPYTHPALRTGQNREMAGFSPFPISKSSLAKEWEEVADREFYLHRAGDLVQANSPAFKANPWLANVNPNEIVYMAPYVDEMHMFTHTLDELENALNPTSGLPQNLLLKPEDMQQLSIEKAFRLVNNINDWRLQQRTAANLEEAKRAAVTYKAYPDAPRKLQWQELKSPEYTELPPGYALENVDYNTVVLKDPSGKALTYIDGIASGKKDPLKEALQFLSKNDLERALKYEGSTMRHCVGGYCDDVWSGDTRIFSLRDNKGEPHTTIEVAPTKSVMTPGAFYHSDNISESLLNQITEMEKAGRFEVGSPDFIPFESFIRRSPEYQAYIQLVKNEAPLEIIQIKGKGNAKPSSSYIPYVQDFLTTQRWSRIQDLGNADVVALQPMMLKNARDKGFNPQILFEMGGQSYITKEEFNRLAEKFGGINKMSKGGEVSKFIKAHA